MRLIFLAACFCLTGCYVMNQALVQNSLLNSRKPVSEVIQAPETSKKVRKKLKFTQKVLRCAAEEGLNTQRAYDYFVAIDGDAVSYVVYGAEKLKLESVTWWFPVVGTVPYLGFFDPKKRDEEALDLVSQGYDVSKGSVGAFSSLGWFEDPIYSPMLRRSDASLAHLFLHELIHRSFWSQGSVRFNENLAEYCSLLLTEKFLLKEGRKRDLVMFLARRSDRKKYKIWLKDLKEALTDLYAKPLDEPTMLSEKAKVFRVFLSDRWPSFESKGYRNIKNREWNNARVVSASLYSPDTERFAKAHSCLPGSSVGEFLSRIKEAEMEYDDAFEALDSLCRVEDSEVD